MNVLITGGSSLLGKSLIETRPAEVKKLTATWYTNYVGVPMFQMDVCDQSQVRYVFDRARPDAVIHCAAIGSVDWTERNYSEAYAVNFTGVENVLAAARDRRARFVHISTNAVFKGDHPPYAEDDERRSVNRYGAIKSRAEDLVMKKCLHWLIIRPFLLYGWPWPGGRGNWATLVIEKLRKGEKLRVVDDTFWQPTYSLDCATAIWRLLQTTEDNGVWHVASEERVSLHHFAYEVADVFGLDKGLLEAVGSDAFPNIAPRPRDTSYRLDKLHEHGIFPSDVREGLEKMKASMIK